MKLDFLIIGQGLAGSLLAWELMQRNCRVLVVDNGDENASLCAAGLINPITGMRFVKSSQLETLLPVAKARYQQLGDFFQQTFYVEKKMLRIFANVPEINAAQKRLQDENYAAYVGEIQHTTAFNAPLGVLEQRQTAYLLIPLLLAALKQFFIAQNSYRQHDFDFRALQLKPELRWQAFQPKQIIFCEGYLMRYNPWFSWLPLQPAKGEILTLASLENLAPDKILNYGKWLIPLGNNLYKTGATFEPQHLNTHCSDAAKQQLLDALHNILPDMKAAQVIKHQANIRPCTLDKQPFIGRHPHHPQLAIFNGFGAKGSLQIPFYSQQFADYLLENKPLDSNIDIRRVIF